MTSMAAVENISPISTKLTKSSLEFIAVFGEKLLGGTNKHHETTTLEKL